MQAGRTTKGGKEKIFKKVEKTKKIRLTDGKGRDTMITPLLRGY
jgi:hypothetical protein